MALLRWRGQNKYGKAPATALVSEKLNKSPGKLGMIIFGLAGVSGESLISRRRWPGICAAVETTSLLPYLLLGVALLTALAF